MPDEPPASVASRPVAPSMPLKRCSAHAPRAHNVIVTTRDSAAGPA